MKNKKAFTLVELLAVIMLLAIVMILIFPSIKEIFDDNKIQEYETYEDLMIEYTKTFPNYQKRSKICLSELNIDKLNEFICTGYVTISSNTITPYLSCKDKNGNNSYHTDGFNTSLAC